MTDVTDVIPDPIPIVGCLDDLIVVPLGVALALNPKTSADNKVNAEKGFYFSSLRAELRIAPQLDFMQTGVPK